MNILATLPRHTWPERVSLTLAGGLTVLGGLALAGWLLQIELLVRPFPAHAPIGPGSAAALLLLGVVLLGAEMKQPRVLWLATLPGAFGLLHLLRALGRPTLTLETSTLSPVLADTSVGPPSVATAISLLLASLVLIAPRFRLPSRVCLPAKAIMGSLVAAIGVSTLLGYAGSLPAVYMWGTGTPTSPVSGAGLTLLGLALLALTWRESTEIEHGPPRWAPVPVIIASLTITLIFWLGLREREGVYLNARTQTAMETLAIQIGSELDRQSNAIERLARKWGETIPTETVWEVEVDLQLRDSGPLGCRSFAWLNQDFRAQWVYSSDGHEGTLTFDHAQDEARHKALDEARATGKPVVSGTVAIGGLDHGFTIYVPISFKGEIIGYAAAEYLYRPFFRALIAERLKMMNDYDVTISIGGEQVFSTSPKPLTAGPQVLEKSYTLLDRRLRLGLHPSDYSLMRDRQHLPEIALGAGLGFTLLLGLGVHLARSARAGQQAAESSNRRLIAENEERRRIEARLKISDERLRLALDSTRIGIFEWNLAAQNAYYSPGLWSMLGYQPERMPATLETWHTLIHPDDLPGYNERFAAQLSGHTAFIDPEYRLRAADGGWRWISARAKTVAAAEDGKPIRIIGTLQDITDRREAEQALRASQAEARQLSLVAAKTDNPVLIISPQGNIEWVNESFSRVLEYSLEEVTGRNPLDFLTGPETDQAILTDIRSALARGQGLATDLVHYSKAGRKYHLHLEIQPVRNDAGQIGNFIFLATDITARVESEAQLRRAKSEADAASRAKSEFLASMSHEIRTPMNGVIGMTSLLMETRLTPEQRDFVATIHNSGETLLAIINDILDFSKIESGKLELESIPLDLTSCLEESIELFALQAAGKRIELAYTLAPGTPAWINGDVTRLRQILVNLINNAVKFTSGGSIIIEVRALTEPTGTPRLEFAVRDTGIGIPPDRLDRLFKAFSQVDSSTTRKYGGTGLGLAISQRLCALMGGDIRVESTVGQGSSFIFTIIAPPALPPLKSPMPSLPAPLRDGLTLVVGGSAAVGTQLESWELRVELVSSPAAAKARCAGLDQPPALLIIDGDTTAEAGELAGIACPRLFMLPFGQPVPAALDENHPAATIYKPLKHHTLLQTLSQLFATPEEKTPAPAPKPRPQQLAGDIPLNILLVEDNAVNQKVALRFLERLGYAADAVNNGKEALHSIESRPYDLVLMDLQMPEMDGFEATRRMRHSLPADVQPVIVALTANAMTGDRELCLAAGMDDYISKPVKMAELTEVIRRQFAATENETA